MFRSWFSKKAVALSGTPAVRRQKTYSAQSGYVYQYFYEGQRPTGKGDAAAIEFVFSVSADRKSWHPASVVVEQSAIHQWEQANARELSSTERYAVCKMALFQAFDERATPDLMKSEVRVRAADLAAIIESLGL